MRYLLLFLLLWVSSLQGRTFEVEGGGDKLQEAVNSAGAGDSIIVTDDREYGQVTIENKTDLVIISRAYLNKGDNRFAGDMPKIKYKDKEHTRPHNDDEAQDQALSEEYSTNGALRILKSKNISIIGFNINGDGVWQKYYEVWGGAQLFGNNAIALFNSGSCVIRGNLIHGAYRGIHQKDRNIAGVFTEANPNDVDVDEFSPAGNPLSMGDHLIEQNMIFDNHWGIFLEILWDAASTYRNNLILENGMKNFDYVITEGKGDERDGVDNINWTQYSGGAFKVHGVKYVPIVFQNNTLYKNMLTFNSHWQEGGPNFRFYCNLFGMFEYDAYEKAFNGPGMDNFDKGYESLFNKWGLFELRYIGLEEFKYNTMAKQWDDDGGLGYVAHAKFDGDRKPSGGETLETFSTVEKDVLGEKNKYLGKSSGSTFCNTDDKFSNDFLKPKKDISEIKDRGSVGLGMYDTDMSKADVGAIDENGNWAGTGSPVVIYDRDRYAVVDFMKNGKTSVDIRFRMEYNGKKKIDKIEYVLEKYTADIKYSGYELPEKFSMTLDKSNIDEDEVKKQLSNGDLVEVRYVGLAPEFTQKSKEYARFMLRVKVTDSDGNEYWSNMGYFDYKKVEMQFKIHLFDCDNGNKGDEWESDEITNVYVYQPFWMSVETIDSEGESKDMTGYNDQDVIVTQPEQVDLWTSLWRWTKDGEEPNVGDISEEAGWKLMDVQEGENYLNETWTEDGEWEGIFIFTKPSVGEEHLRVNLKGADALTSAIAGTSNGFVVVAEPDTIVYVRALDATVQTADLLAYRDGQASVSPSLEQLLSIGLVVKDVDGNLLTGQKVTLVIDKEEAGSFVDSDGDAVQEIDIRTSLDGVASFLFQAGKTKGSVGEIKASVKGKGDEVIVATLKVSLIYADNTPAKPRPNILYSGNIDKDIDPENLDRNMADKVNKTLEKHNASSNDPKGNQLIVLDFKVNSKSYPVGSVFKLNALVTNVQGNVVKDITPNKSGKKNPVYVIKDMSDGGSLQIEESPYAEFVGVGEIATTSPGQDVRVAIPWNHINENGRVAEAGVFMVVFVVEAPDGNIERVKSFYIIK